MSSCRILRRDPLQVDPDADDRNRDPEQLQDPEAGYWQWDPPGAAAEAAKSPPNLPGMDPDG